LFRYILCSLKI